MLNLSVCYKCCHEHWPREFVRKERVDCGGKVNCPVKFSPEKNADITDPPPDYCPYRFEHAVAAGMENKNA
jgi:hypothetical protein